MKGLLLAVLIIGTLCGSARAEARFPYKPPAEYDHPFDGELTVEVIEGKDGARDACEEHMTRWNLPSPFPVSALYPDYPKVACTLTWHNAEKTKIVRCKIIIASRPVLRAAGFDEDWAFRHEVAHCNGWSAEHRGAW